MPLYEYECKKCGRRVEKIQKFADLPLAYCEHCGGELERLLSAPAIQFKGSGWYITDYARKASPAPSSSGDSSSASEKKEAKAGPPADAVKTAPAKSTRE